MVTHDISEAISMADKVIVLSKSPSIVKNIYNIDINNELIPTQRRKDIKFNDYYDLIWNELEDNE